MKAYELLFFVDPALDPETRLAVMKRIDTTIAEGNGKVDNVDEWGKRKLAYEINKLTEGDYTLINFHADPAQIAELDRVLRITDAVVRHMIVRRDDQEYASLWKMDRRPRRRHPRMRGSESMSINRVNISGNLTRDPELRATASGTQVLSFGVAVNDRRRNPQTGEWEDYPNFVDCTMFGTRAEAVSRYLSKGSKVAIEGKLRYSSWERDGQRRSKLEVIVDEIEFMSRGGGQGGQGDYGNAGGGSYGGGYAAPAPQAAPAPVQAPPAVDVYDDDIPF